MSYVYLVYSLHDIIMNLLSLFGIVLNIQDWRAGLQIESESIISLKCHSSLFVSQLQVTGLSPGAPVSGFQSLHVHYSSRGMYFAQAGQFRLLCNIRINETQTLFTTESFLSFR